MQTGWKIARWSSVSLVTVALLTVLFIVEENWRGHRAWENYRHELEVAGFRFGPEALNGARISDDHNFANAPLLRPFFDYVLNPETGFHTVKEDQARDEITLSMDELAAMRKPVAWQIGELALLTPRHAEEILRRLQPYGNSLRAITDATLVRPLVQYPLLYEEGYGMPLPVWGILQRLITTFNLRASSELTLRQNDAAFADLETALRLSRFSGSPSILFTQSVRNQTLMESLGTLREGLSQHLWNGAQLQILENHFAEFRILSQLAQATRGELALQELCDLSTGKILSERWSVSPDEAVNFFYHVFPVKGWLDQKLASQARWVKTRFLKSFEPANDRVFVTSDLREPTRPFLMPSSIFGTGMLDLGPSSLLRHASTAQNVQFARLACALERFWLKHRRYPATLHELVPGFIADLPHDVCSGEALHYHQTTSGGYRIWSVGWNLRDEEGVVRKNGPNSPKSNLSEGDWVWIMPGAPAEAK